MRSIWKTRYPEAAARDRAGIRLVWIDTDQAVLFIRLSWCLPVLPRDTTRLTKSAPLYPSSWTASRSALFLLKTAMTCLYLACRPMRAAQCRCQRWHRACLNNWGHGPNYQRCMQYHGC